MNVVHKPQWGQSAQGHSIDMFCSSDVEDQTGERPILFIGGVHGDEPEGVNLARSTLQWLRSFPEKAHTPWILIPCLNPDGYLNHKRTNGNNVDLNRNYPSSGWQPDYEQEKYNPGPKAGSEPEISSLVKLILHHQPRLIIHCHSWNPCIICTGPPGLSDAGYLAQCSGYEVKEHIGYNTPGSLSEYGWKDLNIPVICIEEVEGAKAPETWKRFQPGIEKIFGDSSPRL